jgi:F0F1-type ATP synthase assembly protein I
MGTIADTTWRMFTPVLVLLVVGFWLDNKFHTKPWLVLSGVFIGFGLAIALIWQQYRQIDVSKGKGTSGTK